MGIASYIGAALQDIMNGVLIENNKTMTESGCVYDFTCVGIFLDRCGNVIGIAHSFVYGMPKK